MAEGWDIMVKGSRNMFEGLNKLPFEHQVN